MYNNNIKRLPDAYRKDENSNNYKLLRLNELATQQLQEDCQSVLDTLDLNLATGKTLDLYGQMLGQKRGGLNDLQYRLVLLNKIGANICQGDYNSTVSTLAQIFNCSIKDIALKDVETNKIDVVKLSVNTLVNAGFTGERAIEMIELLLPVCVSVNQANCEGTFEFGGLEQANYKGLSELTYASLSRYTYTDLESGEICLEYDENLGFGNIEQSIGGYFGDIVKKAT